MNENHGNNRRSRFRPVYGLVIAAVAATMVALMIPQRPPTGNRFITADHPIDMVLDHSGRWFYYQADPADGAAPQLAARVRQELLPMGFTEDFSNKPWFRFVKGAREVIVCNHDEIATAPSSGLSETVNHEFHRMPPGRNKMPPTRKWPVLWVHEPGPSTVGFAVFKVKKLVFRW